MLSLAASHISEKGRYTLWHNSALHFVASTLQSVRNSSLYVDFPGFLSPCIITGDQLRPDMLLSIGKAMLYVIDRHPDVGVAGGAMAPPLFCQNIIRRNVKISLVITDYRFKSRIA